LQRRGKREGDTDEASEGAARVGRELIWMSRAELQGGKCVSEGWGGGGGWGGVSACARCDGGQRARGS
jgi:hypothetical protein